MCVYSISHLVFTIIFAVLDFPQIMLYSMAFLRPCGNSKKVTEFVCNKNTANNN